MKTICIMCPMGCPLEIVEKDGEIIVSGNTCARGARYGKDEYTEPKRSVTTLVRLENGEIASTRTTSPVPKARVKDVVDFIGKLTPPSDVKIGDIIAENILELGVDVIITGRK